MSVRRQTLPRPLERKETDPPSGRPHCRGLTWIANAHSHAVPSNLPLTGERGCRLQARPNSRASGEGFETRAVGAPENDGYPPRFSRFSRFSRALPLCKRTGLLQLWIASSVLVPFYNDHCFDGPDHGLSADRLQGLPSGSRPRAAKSSVKPDF